MDGEALNIENHSGILIHGLQPLFCSLDDVLLQFRRQFHEIVAVAAYPDDEIFMIFRMNPCILQFLQGYHIDGKLLPLSGKIGFSQSNHSLLAYIGGKEALAEFHLKHVATFSEDLIG